MRVWVSLGLAPELYWTVTPKEAKAIVAGAHERIIREHNDSLWMAWHTAAWSRAKRMPRLEGLLMKPPKTWQQQRADLRAHLLAAGVRMKKGKK